MGMARANDSIPKKSKKKQAAEPAPIDFATLEHPYVVLLNKKLRSLKKKQEKIKSLEESMVGSNKTLNEQQLEVLANKSLVEKMYAELESLRMQFVETTLTPEQAAVVPPAAVVVEEPAKDNDVVEEPIKAEPAAPVEEVAVAIPAPADVEADKLQYVAEILKLLHAVSMHQALGHDVPIALDYFVKVLMGATRPPAEVMFAENLAESIEEAKRYLNQSDKVLACDMSYHDLRAAVDRLVTPSKAAVEEPTINFFAEPDVATAEPEVVVAEEAAAPVEAQSADEVQEPVPEDALKSFAAATSKRPNSGNRRGKGSPRETTTPAVDGAEKPKQPRRQYKPKVAAEGAVEAQTKPRPQRNATPKPASGSASPTGDAAKAPRSAAPRRPRQRSAPKEKSDTP